MYRIAGSSGYLSEFLRRMPHDVMFIVIGAVTVRVVLSDKLKQRFSFYRVGSSVGRSRTPAIGRTHCPKHADLQSVIQFEESAKMNAFRSTGTLFDMIRRSSLWLQPPEPRLAESRSSLDEQTKGKKSKEMKGVHFPEAQGA